MKAQPVDNVQWIDPKKLHANNYNPNHVAPPELALLKLSILEDGWTQPIVALVSGEIVDGFHRWHLSVTDRDVTENTNGKVPVVLLKPADRAHQMMSTIRHNRARGTHGVLKMAEIVQVLANEMKKPPQEIMRRLGMEAEEVDRLSDTRGMIERGAAVAFAQGWVPD